MKTKHTLFRRGGIYYSQDSATGQQKSLRTRDQTEALQLINARLAASFRPVGFCVPALSAVWEDAGQCLREFVSTGIGAGEPIQTLSPKRDRFG